MKTMFLTAMMGFVGSYAFADSGILGEWNLASRTCTSNAPTSDGVKIGQDKIDVAFNGDGSYKLKRNIAGCETGVDGTYVVDGMKVTFTSATSQSCKETSPQPMVETYSMYAAHLSDKDLVLVATGSKAVACPAGDALILNYEKVEPVIY